MFRALTGALPNAKLIRCSLNSSSVTGFCRDSSMSLINSGSDWIGPRNGFLSAIEAAPFSFYSLPRFSGHFYAYAAYSNIVNSLRNIPVDYLDSSLTSCVAIFGYVVQRIAVYEHPSNCAIPSDFRRDWTPFLPNVPETPAAEWREENDPLAGLYERRQACRRDYAQPYQ
jgi:hypothetical protein